ncbi:MAG: VWA domain-containing protein [Isosphaerales bacterium]
MIARWRLICASAFVVLCAVSPAHAQGNVPTDQEIAGAIAHGVDFLKSAQSNEGHWDDPAQPQHRLGLTALAGLALLENGVARNAAEISKAREIVAELARQSEQTYDIALAILFLARCQQGRRGEADALIQTLGRRLASGDHGGIWDYTVPRNVDETREVAGQARRGRNRETGRPLQAFSGQGDHSNTQFALLGLWAAGRHGFDSDRALESIDGHFRSSQIRDGRWGYRINTPGSEAMSCAGLMGLAIAAARPSVAERQTARARGAALAADPAFQAALRAVGQDARRAGLQSDIYYLWSLERVCVALGLHSLDGFDWYARGARILVDRQENDGGWPHDRWGRLPSTCLALLFLRKANLAFEIDRVLRLPSPKNEIALVSTSSHRAEEATGSIETDPGGQVPPAAAEPAGESGVDDVKVIVTGASEQSFPRISVQFEVKRADGSFLLDAARDDFRVTEEGRDVDVVEFQAPRTTEAIPTTLVLVVDRSLSMEEEDRIGGLKRAVGSFLEKLPEGSKVAVIAFGSEIDRLSTFTTDRVRIKQAVDAIEPAGATRFYDAVASALEMLDHESGRRAVLALTDGEDTFSQSASLESVIGSARRLGLPVYTLGLGTEEEIESGDLRRLAVETRGQYYPAKSADQLRAIYEQIAERIRSSYNLVYQSDRKLPDGTLRPVRIFYRGSRTAGETAVFIPGMVVPAGGWSPLFLGLLAALSALLVLPGRLARRNARA